MRGCSSCLSQLQRIYEQESHRTEVGSSDLLATGMALPGECEVVQDLPRLHAGEDVLDAGPDLFVGLVVRLLPGG
jgi:hypothetical protein